MIADDLRSCEVNTTVDGGSRGQKTEGGNTGRSAGASRVPDWSPSEGKAATES